MKRVIFWFRNARPVALPQSLIPGITAVVLACRESGFSVWLSVLAVFGVSMAHLSLNLFDDYFDYRKKESGYRDTLAREGIRARTIKCPYLLSGEATMRQLLRAALLFGCIAAAAGSVILIFRGIVILLIAVLTVLIGLSYSGGPLSLIYHGFGEFVIGLLFGPLLMIGVYYAACSRFDGNVFWISVGMGMLVVNVLYTHSVLDYEADIRAGKSTLAAVLPQNRSRYFVSVALVVCPYIILAGRIMTDKMTPWFFLVFLTLPWAVGLLISIKKHLQHPERFEKPAGWWGPMENWSGIQKIGIDWFMFRWYLARNVLMGFGILCIAASLVL